MEKGVHRSWVVCERIKSVIDDRGQKYEIEYYVSPDDGSRPLHHRVQKDSIAEVLHFVETLLRRRPR